MLFIANAQGTILNTVPDRVYQGSNNANQVLLAIPLPSSVTIKVAYKLPNGLLTEPALMTYNEQEVEGNPLNVWSIDIPEAITTYYGTVTAQFVATNSQGVKIASGSATFEVERGVAPILPATPTQDIYDQILQALSSIKEDIVNGWLESKALLPYDSTFTYTFGAVVFNANNKELYQSLAELNKGNPLADTTKWQALGFEKAFSDIAELQSDLTALQSTVAQLGTDLGQLTQKVDTIDENVTQNTSDIADIESGAIIVGKATNDADGNNIANTYQTKSNLTTGWGKVLSDTKYPSERLVKTTIDGIISSGGKQSFVFDTQADFLGWIDGTFVRPDGKVVGDVNIADDILIKEQNIPDYWCSSKSNPMTIADFTEYETKTNLTDYLAKDNTEAFTPTGDYNPATKKYVDDNGVGSVDDVNLTIGQETVTYSKQDGVTINSNGQIKYGEKTKDITVEHDIPIVAGDGVSIDKLENEEKIEIKATGSEFITLTTTSGTLTDEQLATLQKSDENYIIFNNNIFRLKGYDIDSNNIRTALYYSNFTKVDPYDGIYTEGTVTVTISNKNYNIKSISVLKNPFSEIGDMVYKSNTGYNATRLPIGTDGQVLTVKNHIPSWQDAQGGGAEFVTLTSSSGTLTQEQYNTLMKNPANGIIYIGYRYLRSRETSAFIYYSDIDINPTTSGNKLYHTAFRITKETLAYKTDDGASVLPTSAYGQAGDILYGVSAGNAQALHKGADNQVLTLQNGLPSWQDAQGGGAEIVEISYNDLYQPVSAEILAKINANPSSVVFRYKSSDIDWRDYYFRSLWSSYYRYATLPTDATPTIYVLDINKDSGAKVNVSSITFLPDKLTNTGTGNLVKTDNYGNVVTLYKGNRGQVLTATDDDIQWQNPQEAPYIEITDVSTTTTSGTLTSEQLATLQSSNNSYILFNNEKYIAMDLQHESGTLVYSHVGQDTANDYFIKCISVTISTRGWVLTTLNMNEYEKVEIVYEITSTDSNINLGYTNGIGNGVTINKSFSKYKMLRCQYQSYNNAIVGFCDLTTPTNPPDTTGRYMMYAVGYVGDGFQELISVINLEKTTLTTYLPGSGGQAAKITKIYGVY